ncbi:MAG: acyltransferase family protein [Puniceicoccaceae bacterium]
MNSPDSVNHEPIPQQTERLYYLDWLRLLAFGLLFIFHSWRPFDHFEWHIKNEEKHVIFDVLTMFTHGWRMHLIFLVSGAGTWFAMRARRETFLLDRIKRLIVPFIFGILILIPPQRYFEWTMFRDFEEGIWKFLMVYPVDQLGAKMGSSVLLWFGHLGTHLWYLPYLFVMTMVCMPLFKRIREGKISLAWLKDILSTRFGVYVLVVPMVTCRFLLKPLYPDYTDWSDFLFYLWPFVYGFMFVAEREMIAFVKSKRHLLLFTGILSSGIFLYLGSTNAEMVQSYISPEFNWLHLANTVIASFIAISWTLFFLGYFAETMNFTHKILMPANASILPIYLLHQTMIVIIGFYIVSFSMSLFLKFALIAMTAIPSSILLYQLIKRNTVTRFLFGMKPSKIPVRRLHG